MRRFVWLLPVVLLPLSVLLVMQYRFLRKLESTTALAERNTLRTSLEEVTREIEDDFSKTTDTALDVGPEVLGDQEAFGEHVRHHVVPGVKSYFAFRFQPPSYLCAGANGKMQCAPNEENEAMHASAMMWSSSPHPPLVPMRDRTIDLRDHNNRIVLRPISDQPGHIIGVSGIVFDNHLTQAVIRDSAAKKLVARLHDPYLSVRVEDDEMAFAKIKNSREYLTEPAGFAFSDWRIGVRDACATPEEIAASNFRLNMLWTLGVAVLMLVAILIAMQAAARQVRLSQMKSDFVSNVSHELRTPLSSIRVFGEYMRLGRVTRDEKIREYGEYIEAESRRLTQLINNILDFSKIESAEKKYHFEEIDLEQLVSQTVAAFEVPVRERGVTVRYRPPAERVPPVRADKDALAQALMNLLDNAVKYSNGRKEIEVELTSSRGKARVVVIDHGIGIPAREQKKIFEKFYRVGSGLVHDVKGSGLGLSIVSHIAKAHGGAVEVSSVPGEGSAFTIVLPAEPKSQGATFLSTSSAAPLQEEPS